MTKPILVIFLCCVFVFSVLKVANAVQAASPTIGILGDSNTDEYRADDNRAGGTPYANTTLNWAELLVKKRGFDAGTWGVWGEPRRTGYAYNWARSAATADSMIRSGQHTGLAAQVAAGQIEYVIIYIGTNDFHSWNGTYDEVYNGTLTGNALQTKIDNIVARIRTAVDTIKAADHPKIVLANYADPGQIPSFLIKYPSATGRARVTNAILSINAQLSTLASSRGIVLADLYDFNTTLQSRIDANGNLIVGGETIAAVIKGDEPHHLELNDSIGHLGTVGSGLLANFFLKSLADGYGLAIAQFSDSEVLGNAGIVVPTPTPTTGVAHANLRVTITDTPDPVLADALLTYSVVVSNLGTDVATNVALTDTLPANLYLISFVPTQGVCTLGTGVINCSLGTLNNSASASVTILMRPNYQIQNTTITNRATVSALQVDPIPANNSFTATTKVNASSGIPMLNLFTTSTPTLTWNSVTWAVAYEIEVDNDSGFNSPNFENNNIPQGTFTATTSPLADGIWYWHVRAKHEDGIWGGWSATASFMIDTP